MLKFIIRSNYQGIPLENVKIIMKQVSYSIFLKRQSHKINLYVVQYVQLNKLPLAMPIEAQFVLTNKHWYDSEIKYVDQWLNSKKVCSQMNNKNQKTIIAS